MKRKGIPTLLALLALASAAALPASPDSAASALRGSQTLALPQASAALAASTYPRAPYEVSVKGLQPAEKGSLALLAMR